VQGEATDVGSSKTDAHTLPAAQIEKNQCITTNQFDGQPF
jgi:hypothetical protein